MTLRHLLDATYAIMVDDIRAGDGDVETAAGAVDRWLQPTEPTPRRSSPQRRGVRTPTPVRSAEDEGWARTEAVYQDPRLQGGSLEKGATPMYRKSTKDPDKPPPKLRPA